MIRLGDGRQSMISWEAVMRRPEMDHLGYAIEDRERMIAAHLSALQSHWNVLQERPAYAVGELPRTSSLLRFHSSHKLRDLHLNHFQLHHTLKALGEHALLYTASFSVNSWDMISNAKTALARMPLCENLALDPGQTLLAASIDRNKWCLYSLAAQAFHARRAYKDLVNCSCFASARTVAVGGNFLEMNLIDVETAQEKQRVDTLAYVNSIDYADTHRLYGLAMDSTAVQLVDPRDRFRVGFLGGHLDYNFAVRFLNEHRIATAGQDGSTRIWDLRRGGTELRVLPGRNFGVYGLEFNPRDDVLYAIELYGYLHAYALRGPEVAEQTFLYPSILTGLALSPSLNRLFLGVMQTRFVPFNGVLVFETDPSKIQFA